MTEIQNNECTISTNGLQESVKYFPLEVAVLKIQIIDSCFTDFLAG